MTSFDTQGTVIAPKRIALIGGTAPAGGRAAPELQSLVGDGVELVAYPSRVGSFPRGLLEKLLQEVGHADAAFAAVADGAGAVVIDSVGDYGLAAMRASLPVPAFGAGESGMAAATAGGRLFAIVTVWPESMNFIVEALLRAYGHTNSCIGIFNIGADGDVDGPSGPVAYLSRIQDGHRSVVDAASQAIVHAASLGAEAVMLGCTCMSGIAERLAKGAPVPVINPLGAAVSAAGAAGSVARPDVRPESRDMLSAMVEAVADRPAEDCPVCITEWQD